MKAYFSGLILALMLCIGCLPSTTQSRRDEKLPELPFREEVKHVPAVSPDGINEKNAWQRAKQLRAEIEADTGR
ncbi:MAG: hypothetical protein SNJ82_01065 [Gemmataceae bacterium]